MRFYAPFIIGLLLPACTIVERVPVYSSMPEPYRDYPEFPDTSYRLGDDGVLRLNDVDGDSDGDGIENFMDHGDDDDGYW